jgi:outer membrane lipoprotein LolB
MRIICLTLLSLVITSCASFYTIPDTKHIEYTKPHKIDNQFSLSGRFNIKSGRDVQYGNFNWYKESAIEELTFNTPLGQSIAKITIDSNGIVLYTADKKYTGSDVNQLMMEQLGFVIPLSYLHYWVQASSLPNVAVTKTNRYGFTQLGWRVEYLDWYDSSHPRVLRISNLDTTIKLFVVWQ